MKVAIAYLTKDRVELTKQSIKTFGFNRPFDIFWVDGSSTVEGIELARQFIVTERCLNVKGGADAAIVFALTRMLEEQVYDDDGRAAGFKYTHVGLCENDVLLHKDWFGPTMALFERGRTEGLEVGAVSARAYEDRVLIQRDGYAVMHNLGAGHVVFSRKAAKLVLEHYRTGWWPDNRAVFAQLSSLDIGRWGAFRTNAQWVTCDWHFDTALAQNGLACMALTPSLAEMIGQDPPLEEQGLTLVREPVELLRNDYAFELFAQQTFAVRNGDLKINTIKPHHQQTMNGHIYFAHQLPANHRYNGDWKLKWSQGFGPFAWQAVELASVKIPLLGPVGVLVAGGKDGACVHLRDDESGYEMKPALPPGEFPTILQVPGDMRYRPVTLVCDSGALFYGVQTVDPQPTGKTTFDFSKLPRIE